MFSHIFLGSDDLATAKTFYDALFAAVGGPEGKVDPVKRRVVYLHKGAAFIIATPINGEPATAANGGTIGFGLESAAQVDAWHAAGVANGGTSIEGAPGLRADSNLYLAYLRDPAGNKLCALYRPA